MSANGFDAVNAVKETIYKACLLQDDQMWSDWLDLCDQDFQYSIKAFSPEINYDMTYFSGDFEALTTVTELLPKHNTDHSPLKRHARGAGDPDRPPQHDLGALRPEPA